MVIGFDFEKSADPGDQVRGSGELRGRWGEGGARSLRQRQPFVVSGTDWEWEEREILLQRHVRLKPMTLTSPTLRGSKQTRGP